MVLATHNSGTGEKGHGWWSLFLEPFAKCQNKTLAEQYREGVRLFDIRVRKIDGEWYFAHGLWRSDRPVGYSLSDLNLCAFKAKEKAVLMVTYEGICDDKKAFVAEVDTWSMYSWLEVAEVNVRQPKWRCLRRLKGVRYSRCFRILDGTTWHTLLPFPWLWAKFGSRTECYDGKGYKMVDFV